MSDSALFTSVENRTCRKADFAGVELDRAASQAHGVETSLFETEIGLQDSGERNLLSDIHRLRTISVPDPIQVNRLLPLSRNKATNASRFKRSLASHSGSSTTTSGYPTLANPLAGKLELVPPDLAALIEGHNSL